MIYSFKMILSESYLEWDFLPILMQGVEETKYVGGKGNTFFTRNGVSFQKMGAPSKLGVLLVFQTKGCNFILVRK